MIQAVVSRMSSQCATLKNYCVTISVALAGFAITLQRPVAALLTLVPILAFAFLDVRYLQLERRFRERFDAVTAEGWDTPPNSAPERGPAFGDCGGLGARFAQAGIFPAGWTNSSGRPAFRSRLKPSADPA